MRSLRLLKGGPLFIFTSIQYQSLLFSTCVRNLDLQVQKVMSQRYAGLCTRANAFSAVMSQVTIFKIGKIPTYYQVLWAISAKVNIYLDFSPLIL